MFTSMDEDKTQVVDETTTTEEVATKSTSSVESDQDPLGIEQYKKDEGINPPEKSDETKPEEQKQTYAFEGREYTQEQIQAALQDSFNKSKWQAELTKQSQTFAEKEREFNERLQSVDRLSQHLQPKPQQAELTPEQKQIKELLDSMGYVHNDMLKEKLSKIDQFEKIEQEKLQQEAMKQVVNELDSVQKKYGISDQDKRDLWNYARDNDMTTFDMESVYIHKNKDKLSSYLTSQDRIEAGEKRKEAATKVQSSRSNSSGKQSSLTKYDSSRDKDLSLDELIARATANM